MTEKNIDWLLAAALVVIFIIALFLGFQPERIFEEGGITFSVRIVYLSFIAYGVIGFKRKRVLVGPRARLITGGWAMATAIMEILSGLSIFLYDLYKLFLG